MKKILLLSILIVIAFSGCSVSKTFMPYEEEPLCRKGYGAGYCGSVREVYELTIEE